MYFTHGHGLIVGVGADLPNTIEDAKGIANILCDKDRCAYPSEQVILLTGQNAKRNGILDGFKKLSKSIDAKSTAIVYFSGHGYRVRSGNTSKYFLLPHGYELDHLTETGISGEEFSSVLKDIAAQKVLVLLDCCHAAGVDQTKSPGLVLEKAAMPPEAEQTLAGGKGRMLIASSQADQVSFAGKPYSAFTLALIEALTGSGANDENGFVRVADLAMYTSWRVAQRTRQRQLPVMRWSDQTDNFNVAYYAAGGFQPKGAPFDTPTEVEPEPGAWSRHTEQLAGLEGSRGDGASDRQTTFFNINNEVGGHLVQSSGPIDLRGADLRIGGNRTPGTGRKSKKKKVAP
jgi:hypothetical protein